MVKKAAKSKTLSVSSSSGGYGKGTYGKGAFEPTAFDPTGFLKGRTECVDAAQTLRCDSGRAGDGPNPW